MSEELKSFGQSNRREFLQSMTSLATTPQSALSLVTEGAAGVLKSDTDAVPGRTSLTHIVSLPRYTSPFSQKVFELLYGQPLNEIRAIDEPTHARLRLQSARIGVRWELAYTALRCLPEEDPVRRLYAQAIGANTMEEDEMGRLVEEGLALRGQSIADLPDLIQENATGETEENTILENIGYSNASEIVFRSGISQMTLLDKWLSKSRSKKISREHEEVLRQSVQTAMDLDSNPVALQTLSMVNATDRLDLEPLLEALHADEVFEAVRGLFPAIEDDDLCISLYQLAHANEAQIAGLARMLADPKSALNNQYTIAFWRNVHETVAGWRQIESMNAQEKSAETSERKEVPKQQEERPSGHESVSCVIDSLRAPAERIAGQIRELIQMKEAGPVG